MKSVQATLLHVNSSDEAPRHNLCPTGKDSWCKYQVAKAHNEEYHHKHPPIPDAIIQLIKPIYAHLGSRSLLEKCVDGYTQNANESLHSVVWKLCPKVLHLGKEAVDTACALAVCSWNDGVSSFQAIAEHLETPLTLSAAAQLQYRDIARVKKARYRVSEQAKMLRRRARRRRKGLEDTQQRTEGVMYAAGAFDLSAPGPSGQSGGTGETGVCGGEKDGGGGRQGKGKTSGGGGKGKGRASGGGKGKGKACGDGGKAKLKADGGGSKEKEKAGESSGNGASKRPSGSDDPRPRKQSRTG